ncbi:MAG: hypothetical protein N3G20_12335, partial [Verrucomicrobiae bacterium]|nr:hypothetical protein [Verrucomicrobiae bacterium]
LLGEFDDMYVIMGPGDEVALRFDAGSSGQCPPGFLRCFILISHSWCKDMDLYTSEPETIEPLPFKGMKTYPYATGLFPDTPTLRAYRERYNTRTVY